METHKTATPNEGGADGSEENADDEESWKDGAWGEYRLPSLQSLLFEGSIYEERRWGMVSLYPVHSSHPRRH